MAATLTAPTQEAVLATGRRIAAGLPSRWRAPWREAQDQGMRAMGADPALQAALFRVVDVAPACTRPGELGEHLAAYLDASGDQAARRALARLTTSGTASRGGRRALDAASLAAVRMMAGRFILAASPQAAVPALERRWRADVASSLDLLGEATVTDAEADGYAQRCADALERLAHAARAWPSRPLLERDRLGPTPAANLSVKLSALTARLRPHAPAPGIADAGARLRPLLELAAREGAHLHVDMESLDTRDATLEATLGLLDQLGEDAPSAGVVLQAYLRDAEDVGARIAAWVAERPASAPPLTVRLVKGAYWDHELVEAAQETWDAPVWEDRGECDRCFERCTLQLLDAARGGGLRVAIASHNLRSVAHAVAAHEARGGAPADLELQVLHGLGDRLGEGLAAQGHRVRVYAPVGEVVAGMAYLVRRLLENTANTSFLAQAQHADLDALLAAP